MEFYLRYNVPQHWKRGCLVLTRVDAWRDPESTGPHMDDPWPKALRTPPPVAAYLQQMDPTHPNTHEWRILLDLVAQLSAHTRSFSWPGIPGFTRVIGDRAGTVMREYGKPAEFPCPWYSQIVPLGGSFRWMTPQELARLRGIPDSIPAPADRFHAYAAIGDALPPWPRACSSPGQPRDSDQSPMPAHSGKRPGSASGLAPRPPPRTGQMGIPGGPWPAHSAGERTAPEQHASAHRRATWVPARSHDPHPWRAPP